ncbi:MAG: helix-turn-helix transcriptional regulator [Alloprevotella sp.]
MKSYRNRLKAERADQIYVDILQKLIGEKYYRRPDFHAADLAAELGIDRRYISAAVATHTHGGNYNALVNDIRLREACRMLTSLRYRNYTAEEVGLAAGYASRQAFYVAFRKRYGLTPRQYRLENSDDKPDQPLS